ncbi:PaaX family transcriptional regulator [Prauserella shujinwangii]|uniref:PaaX family transcriptional regulator n=1 Tax=Prauserella shujinwangii TaxID=1453103 RepID=A0A2T0LR19_9PSEU|nr:PaaX family transcriptional regulator C-terminal domain-containing protein [Prauserella shujinwangii]PRX45928.1 PaaX family transcriptional regulator [Prauserella shujinwangii]
MTEFAHLPVESEAAGDTDEQAGGPHGAARPQALLLTFFGGYVLGRGVHVATSSVLDVLARVGLSEHATRSTLSRMARRGLLHRTRRGRKVYLGLTRRSRQILHDGEIRIWRLGAVNTHWDGTWTLLGFTMPESWQRQRHVLRSRLLWAGFGSLQGGLWIAPSTVEVEPLLEGLEAAEHVKVFQARALPPTDVDDLVHDAWDLGTLAARYHRFLERWGSGAPPADPPDSLAKQLLLQTEWLQIVRQDPRLPQQHLPADWPAERAQRVFRALHADFEPAARATAADVLDTIPDEEATIDHIGQVDDGS